MTAAVPRSPFSKTIAFLVSLALVSATLAQEGQQTRPRRTTNPPPPPVETSTVTPQTTRLTNEPTVRIGLATNLRAAIISTTGRLLKTTDEGGQLPPPEALAVTRVRVEPRTLVPPLPSSGPGFRVEIAGAATRVDAERAAREIESQTNERAEVSFDAQTNTWRLGVGSTRTRDEAEDLRTRLEEAGFASATVVDARNASSSSSNARNAAPASAVDSGAANSSNTASPSMVRPVTRASTPTRAAVVYSGGASMLFTSYAPIVFASDDERNAPVRFNEKPYRGRLEVFANAQGSLTVVNVLGLEDYVRGVVPNELSPGSYGAIEALKAQAVAARTYAVKNRNQFASQGFDLLPTTRSQVYGGLSTEHPVSSRAVEETRGFVATYKGEPINALYTSTCGGRTENSENIFTRAEPYLRGRECSIEGRAHFAPFTIKTSREPSDIREEANAASARDVALLAVNDFNLGTSRVTDQWLTAPANALEARNLVGAVARMARNPLPVMTDDVVRPPAFATALAAALYGEGRADTLLSEADIEYLLSFRDAGDVTPRNRADVALAPARRLSLALSGRDA